MIRILFQTVLTAVMLLTGSGCSQSVQIADSPEGRLEKARAITALEVESGALENMLDEGAALATDATADMLMFELAREPSEADLAELEAIIREGLAEYLTVELFQETVAKVYAANFTAGELQEIVAFYGSPTGYKVLGLQQSLDSAVGDAVDAALEVHIDEFSAQVDAVLAERFPELNEEDS